jgi:hypothetical protein
MRKPASIPLFQYLSERGLLHASDEAIHAAKRAYRAEYTRKWAKQRPPRKDVRPKLSLKQYAALKVLATEQGFKSPTAYTRQCIIAALDGQQLIPNRDLLLQALQQVGMAAAIIAQNGNPHAVAGHIQNAEHILRKYLQ